MEWDKGKLHYTDEGERRIVRNRLGAAIMSGVDVDIFHRPAVR